MSFLGIIAVLHLAVTGPTKKFVLLLLLAACKGLHVCGRFFFKDSTFIVCNQMVVVALFEAPVLAFSLYSPPVNFFHDYSSTSARHLCT